MASQIKHQDNGNIELSFSISWNDITQAMDKVVDKAVLETEIKGFRKGHAPKDLVEAQLDKSKVLSQAINDVLPKAYAQAVSEHQIKPVVYPKVQIQKGEEGKDWEFLAITCEAPVVELPDLTKTVAKLESKLEIRVEAIAKASKVKLSDLIIEQEANHRLSHLGENLSFLGVTVDKYLESKKITIEELRSKTATEAKRDLEMEFILQKIQVDQKLKDRKETLDYVTNLI